MRTSPDGEIVCRQKGLDDDEARSVAGLLFSGEKLPENCYYIEHRSDGETVTADTDRDYGSSGFKPSMDRPAVELLGIV